MSATWVDGASGSGFDIDHLPYGSFTADGLTGRRLGVRIGGHVLDLRPLAERGRLPIEAAAPDLNALLSNERSRWEEVRQGIVEVLTDEANRAEVEALLRPVSEVQLHLPVRVADYVDFYSSEAHAANLGRMFRPDAEPLLPNWKHLPVGYHGRSGTVVVSGTDIHRPSGQRRGEDGPTFGPSGRLDIELEMGFVLGAPTELGQPVDISAARNHIFGLALVNDWSARDIQAWEYVPLGPFLGKSFATSMSAWITPLEALDHARTTQPSPDPQPLEYLRVDGDWAFDVELTVDLTTADMRARGDAPHRISTTNLRHLYWSAAQQLSHMTVNGARVRAGDLYASGTISGWEPGSFGSLIELTWNGAHPIDLPDGTSRAFLEDGDEIVLAGRTPSLELGHVRGTIVA